MAWSGFIKKSLRNLVFYVPITVAFVDHVGYVAKVEGISMQPSLNPNEQNASDFVFLNKWSVRKFDIKHGDVVALICPKDPDQKLIKRIIAKQGDTIKAANRLRFVNIPVGHCWVEGDHLAHSMDSNMFGPVSMNSCEHSLNTLRYADRVKELGAENPEMKSDQDQNNDLALLCSTNEGEMSADLYSFHEAISNLQQLEEDVLDNHRTVTEGFDKWLRQHNELLHMSNDVDYDVDSYAQRLELILTEQIKELTDFRDTVSVFRQQLAEEEKISKNIKDFAKN